METRLKLKPGQNGTKGVHRKYGDRLLCVRYVYDRENRVRHKTVELIEETVPWKPETVRQQYFYEIPPEEPRLVRVAYEETALREQVKQHGGRWNREEGAWSMKFEDIERLGLASRIIDKSPVR